jgi:peroxiredoxin Q/BCP
MSETNGMHRRLDTKGMSRMRLKKKLKKIAIWGGVIAIILGIFIVISSETTPNATYSDIATQGMVAPDFNLPSDQGGMVRLSSFRGKQNVLIYFGEGLTCDPCMQQMPELDQYIPQFNKLNVKLLFVAFDSPSDMKKAVAQYNLQTPVLSYENANTDQEYNLEANSMGMGRRAGHTFVLVGTNGKILWRKDYYAGEGMNVPSTDTMYVGGSQILAQVQKALGEKS